MPKRGPQLEAKVSDGEITDPTSHISSQFLHINRLTLLQIDF